MNTHEKYATDEHHHFDWLYELGGEWEYPSSGLLLARAGDGRWFIEQAFGREFDRFPGVLRSAEDLETGPTFYPDLAEAARAAFALMAEVYPSYRADQLERFLSRFDPSSGAAVAVVG